jgi:hypothetical protein
MPQRAKNEKESKSEQSVCCASKCVVYFIVLSVSVIAKVIRTYSIFASERFVVSLRLTPFFMLLAHGHVIFLIQPQRQQQQQPQIIAPNPTPSGSS